MHVHETGIISKLLKAEIPRWLPRNALGSFHKKVILEMRNSKMWLVIKTKITLV